MERMWNRLSCPDHSQFAIPDLKLCHADNGFRGQITHPQVRKIRLIRVFAVQIQIRRLCDIRPDAHNKLYDWVLKDGHPLPPVPSDPILGRFARFLGRDLQSAEKEIALAVMRADELEQQQEEVAQGEGLHQVGPWGQVEVGRGRELPDELDNTVNWDEKTDAQNLELLVWFREVCRVPEHKDQNGKDGETCAAASDDASELVEREAIWVRVGGCCEGVLILAIAQHLVRHSLQPTISSSGLKLWNCVAKLSWYPALAGSLMLGLGTMIED